MDGLTGGAPPVSHGQLAADLRALALRPGGTFLVHCSLRNIGPVEGGPVTLLATLREAAGPDATLLVPTQTTLNSPTSRDFRAAVAGLDDDERERFIAAIPGFDLDRTPSYKMGALAEYLRTRSAAVRSHHPLVSFAALGPRAQQAMSVHDLDCHLGDRSPLGWLYQADADILLLGVDYTVCTTFHLAEYRLPGITPVQEYRCFTAGEHGRAERVFTAPALDDSDFGQLGTAFEATPGVRVRRARVGTGTGRLVSVRQAVDFAVAWLTVHRRRASQQ